MGSAVQSSPLTMRAFLTVFLAVAVCGEADPYTIGQVLAGRTSGGVITGVSHPGVGTVAGFPYTAYTHPYTTLGHYIGKREAEPEPYTIGQVLTGQTAGGEITSVDYGHGLGKVAGFPYTAAVAHTVVPAVSYAHHGVLGYGGLVYGKREAEAEPYTIGQVLAGRTAGGVITGVGYPATYAHHVAPVVHHGVLGYNVYGKREADAEPQYFGVLPYHAGVVANTGLGHAVAVTGYGHVTHSANVGVCTNVSGVQVPC